jgi:hypothetical protein
MPLGLTELGRHEFPEGLPPVQRLVAFRVVPDQDFAEGRLKSFDVVRERFAVLEIELFPAALLAAGRSRVSLHRGSAENIGAELFVDENTAFSLGTPAAIEALKPS